MRSFLARSAVFAVTLLAAYPSSADNHHSALLDAVWAHATTTVTHLLAEGADPNQRFMRGWTPLIVASAEKDLDTVITLLDAKADPNSRNDLGRTPLMYASGGIGAKGDAIVERLLAAGADVNIVDDTGWTALMVAAKAGRPGVVELLLRRGADPTIKSKQNETALGISQRHGHDEVTQILEGARNRGEQK